MTSPAAIPVPIQLGAPFHIGSVQHLHDFEGRPEWMIAETSDGGSVFDVGTIFEIPGSGACRALFRHAFYSHLGMAENWSDALVSDLSEEMQTFLSPTLNELQVEGFATHHVGMIDGESGQLVENEIPETPSSLNVVRRFPVITPDRLEIAGQHVWDYSRLAKVEPRYVVPLEVIVRFGFTPQSSLFRKYATLEGEDAQRYAQSIGVESGEIVPWEKLATPIVDFTSKYEDTDRTLDWQEAVLISGLDGPAFKALVARALLAGLALRRYFGEMGLELWDLKWEFAREGDDLVLVDTIDTDSVRATVRTEKPAAMVHANKQSVRDHYQLCHADWLRSVNETKAAAKTEGTSFSALLQERQDSGQAPANPVLDPAFLAIHSDRMDAISTHLAGTSTASETQSRLRGLAEAEIAYYRKNSEQLDQYLEINGL